MADASAKDDHGRDPGLSRPDPTHRPKTESAVADPEGDAGAGGPAEELLTVVQQLGGVLLSAETIESAVQLVVEAAVRTIPGSVGAGVTLVDPHGTRSLAASSVLVEEADRLQYEFEDGPCLTAWREQTVVRVDDVATEARWPRWTAAVASLGVRSALSSPLVAGGTSVGAIKVYADRPNAYDASEEDLLQIFARQAAILLTNAQSMAETRQLTAQLMDAMRSRTLLATATGILLARGATDEQEALDLLVRAAQRSNLPVHEVARRLVASPTGEEGGAPDTDPAAP